MSDHERPPLRRAAGGGDHAPNTTDAVDTDELLSLLGDEYAREILATLGEESLPAREIVDRTGISRPTVYRRLNRLEAAGAVETVMSIHPEGQHRKQFRIVVDELEVSLTGEGDSLVVAPGDDPGAAENTEPRQVAHTSW